MRATPKQSTRPARNAAPIARMRTLRAVMVEASVRPASLYKSLEAPRDPCNDHLVEHRRAASNWMVAGENSDAMDLPRFRGGLRAWDQGIWSDGILPSYLVAFFCSAPGGAILPSRPAQWCGRRAQRRSREGGRKLDVGRRMPGAGLSR